MKQTKDTWEADFDRRVNVDNYPDNLIGDSLLLSYDDKTIERYPESQYELDIQRVKKFIRSEKLKSYEEGRKVGIEETATQAANAIQIIQTSPRKG